MEKDAFDEMLKNLQSKPVFINTAPKDEKVSKNLISSENPSVEELQTRVKSLKTRFENFKNMNIDKQITMTNVDCNALLYFTRVYLDDMLKNDEGHIINVASIAGFLPGPYMCTYHACKAYVLLLGEAISYEIRKTKVKLLTLCPGPFLSNFVKLAHNDYTFEKIKPVSAEKVATFGYKKSLKGKNLAIVGFKNKMTVFAAKIAPRRLVTSSSAKTMKKE
jgi:short-subunit dehydrogenase